MKVSSPVGDFPFQPTSMRFQDGGLVVEGAMGAWPATIQVGPSDVLVVVRILPRSLVAVLVGLLVLFLAWLWSR